MKEEFPRGNIGEVFSPCALKRDTRPRRRRKRERITSCSRVSRFWLDFIGNQVVVNPASERKIEEYPPVSQPVNCDESRNGWTIYFRGGGGDASNRDSIGEIENGVISENIFLISKKLCSFSPYLLFLFFINRFTSTKLILANSID